MDVVTDEQEVVRLATDWAAAERHSDVTALTALLADDFVAVGPRGFLLTKQDWLQRHTSGDLKHESLTLEDVSVRLYGDAAVVIGRETDQGTYQGHPMAGEFRMTLICVRRQERWLLVGTHLSPFAPLS